jgi:hypothetical protein
MRFKRRDLERPFKLPLLVPLAYLAITLAFLVFPIVSQVKYFYYVLHRDNNSGGLRGFYSMEFALRD